MAKEITRKLKIIIMESGMTTSEFVQKVGISKCYLSQIIHGKRNPSKKLDRRIRTVLNYWKDDLYDVDVNAAENIQRAIVRNIRFYTQYLKNQWNKMF